MKIDRVDIAKFRMPLAQPFVARGVNADVREGRVVRITASDGTLGYGEISPLPGLHAETLSEVDEVLRQIAPGLEGQAYPSFEGFAQNVANRAAACARHGDFGCPSVVFGLQSAGLAVLARQADTTPAHLLSPTPRDLVAVNALFVGGPADAAEAIEDGQLAPFTVVKVKCGLRPAAEDRAVIDILLAGLPEHTALRLDGNRGLSLEEALARFDGLPPHRIEYLEEPLADPLALGDLHGRTGLAIGLDETLHIPTLFDIGRASYVAAWCLKPARVGHWQRLLFLAGEAHRLGAAAVVSSCVETGLGLSMQAQMAAALPGRPMAAGLGTETWLRLDLVTPPYDASQGRVRTADWRHTISDRVLQKLDFRRGR